MMKSVQEISQYIRQLNKTSIEQDRYFLSSLGEFLRTANRRELSNSGALIFYIEQFLDEFNEKYFGYRSNFSEETEDVFIAVRAKVMELAMKTEEANLDASFFADSLKLGRHLHQLSRLL